eukprot:1194979-Prorocentrum_minimum.AAC.4
MAMVALPINVGALHCCEGELHGCAGELHGCAGELHGCAGVLHGCAGELHGCAGKFHGLGGRAHRGNELSPLKFRIQLSGVRPPLGFRNVGPEPLPQMGALLHVRAHHAIDTESHAKAKPGCRARRT